MKNIQHEYIEDSPTVVVTFIINEKHPENSTYLVDFDRCLHVKEDEWNELNKNHKLMAMIDNLKLMLPQLMINRDKEFTIIDIEKETNACKK
jgi:hypothetical protein